MQSIPVAGKTSRPTGLQMPDGTSIAVRSWVDLAEQAVRWLLEHASPLPIPFEGCTRARWFLNHAPVHKRDEQRKNSGQSRSTTRLSTWTLIVGFDVSAGYLLAMPGIASRARRDSNHYCGMRNAAGDRQALA